MDIKKVVGIRIKSFRENRGITQHELSELIDRSVDTISHLERGISLPNFRTLEMLSSKLGYPMRDFFPGSDAETRNPKRAALSARLVELMSSLSLHDLEIAIEQIEVLAKRTERDPKKSQSSTRKRRIELD